MLLFWWVNEWHVARVVVSQPPDLGVVELLLIFIELKDEGSEEIEDDELEQDEDEDEQKGEEHKDVVGNEQGGDGVLLSMIGGGDEMGEREVGDRLSGVSRAGVLWWEGGRLTHPLRNYKEPQKGKVDHYRGASKSFYNKISKHMNCSL